MDTAAYKVWASQIPALTQTQRSDVITRFKLLSGDGSREHKGKQEFGDRVLHAICEVLTKNRVECPSYSVLRKSVAYTNAKGKMDDLEKFFDTISKSRLMQDQVLKESVLLLYNDLLKWDDVAISSYTIIGQVHRLPSVLNKSFPGYAQSGILHRIVKHG